MEQEYKVKSLVKAMKLLECFTINQPELSIKELSEMLGLQKSTVHNIADTFRRLGYLNQNPESEKYYLGVRLLQFSYTINNHLGIRKFFLPFMEQISRQTHELTFLGIPHDNEVLYIECQFPAGSMPVRSILGEHAPMYCTGLGKAMLAFLPAELREEYISRPLTRFTERTIVNSDALRAELEEIRRRGYALDNMEHEHGVICIGVPIFGTNRQVVAAISTSAPSLRMDYNTILRTAEIMRKTLEPAQYVL